MGGIERSLVSPEEMKALWRVVRPTYVLQAIGACAGCLFLHQSDKFINLWIGAALGTVIGFVIGLCWHFWDPSRRNGDYRKALTNMGLICALFLIVAVSYLIHPVDFSASSGHGGD